MEASIRSVKAHKGSGLIGFPLTTGFQIYLSKCCDPYLIETVSYSLFPSKVLLYFFSMLII